MKYHSQPPYKNGNIYQAKDPILQPKKSMAKFLFVIVFLSSMSSTCKFPVEE